VPFRAFFSFGFSTFRTFFFAEFLVFLFKDSASFFRRGVLGVESGLLPGLGFPSRTCEGEWFFGFCTILSGSVPCIELGALVGSRLVFLHFASLNASSLFLVAWFSLDFPYFSGWVI